MVWYGTVWYFGIDVAASTVFRLQFAAVPRPAFHNIPHNQLCPFYCIIKSLVVFTFSRYASYFVESHSWADSTYRVIMWSLSLDSRTLFCCQYCSTVGGSTGLSSGFFLHGGAHTCSHPRTQRSQGEGGAGVYLIECLNKGRIYIFFKSCTY